MGYEQRDMSGTLWPARERKTEKHPHYTGEVLIGGTKYRLVAWKKSGAPGRPDFLSLAVSIPGDEPRRSREEGSDEPF